MNEVSTVNNKRIAKNTLMLYIRMFLMMGISLYTSRIVLEVLGVDDYGVNNVVGGLVVLFTFLNNTMAVSTQRFLAYDLGRGDIESANDTFNVAMQLHIGIALLIFVLAETIGVWFLKNYIVVPEGREEAALWVYQFAILGLLINITQVPYSASIVSNERMNIYAYLSIADASLKLVVVFLLYWVDFDKLQLYAMSQFCAIFIMAMIYRSYCIRQFKECKLRLWRWHGGRFREMAGYSGWNMSNHFAYIARTQGVNILVNLFFGPAMNAARAISLQITAAISTFVGNFQQAMNPQIVKRYAVGDSESMNRLLIRGAKYSFFLLFAIACPAIIEMENLLRLWLGNPPEYALVLGRLALISAMIDTMSGLVGYGALASGQVKVYQLTMSAVFLLVPIFTYISYKMDLPVEFCLYSEMFSYVLALFFRPYLVSRVTGFPLKQFLLAVPLRCMAVACISLPFPLYIHFQVADYPFFLSLVSVTITSLLCVAVSIILVGLNQQEKEWIWNKIRVRFFNR